MREDVVIEGLRVAIDVGVAVAVVDRLALEAAIRVRS
jgi:hypothetical protein